MKFIKGSKIFSSVGEKVGELKRVVLDPKTHQISHLVIEKGIIMKEDKVIPIGLIDAQDNDRIGLKVTAEELNDFPAFTETKFKLFKEQSEDGLRAYNYVSNYHWWSSGKALGYAAPRLVNHRLGNIPDDSIALKEGAVVMAPNGEKLGYLERVISDPDSHEISHIVVSDGGMNPTKRLAPIFWVDEISAKKIDLVVRQKHFEKLPEYVE